MAGKLTTHVLDTVRGAGAAQMRVEFRRLDPEPTAPAAVILDIGGRATLVEGGLIAGQYEIVFLVGDYHRALDALPQEPPFLERVPVWFGIGDPDAHYHVPLVMSPYGYSTYRGG